MKTVVVMQALRTNVRLPVPTARVPLDARTAAAIAAHRPVAPAPVPEKQTCQG